MSLHKITMVTMKFAFFFLTLIVLLEAYHARHLRDESVYESFDQRTPFHGAEVIQMVTGDKLRSSPSPPSSYGEVKPKAPPPPPQAAPSQGQATLGRKPKAPPPPKAGPSRGETTYGGDNPNSKGQTTAIEELADLLATVSQKLENSMNWIIYGRDDPRTPPSPNPNGPREQGMYGRVDPKTPPPPNPNDPGRQGMYGRIDPKTPPSPNPNDPGQQGVYGLVDPKTPPSLNPNGPREQGMYRRVDPKAPPSLDANGPREQGMYGRVDPKTPASPNPNGSRGQAIFVKLDCQHLPSRWPEKPQSAAGYGGYLRN